MSSRLLESMFSVCDKALRYKCLAGGRYASSGKPTAVPCAFLAKLVSGGVLIAAAGDVLPLSETLLRNSV